MGRWRKWYFVEQIFQNTTFSTFQLFLQNTKISTLTVTLPKSLPPKFQGGWFQPP